MKQEQQEIKNALNNVRCAFRTLAQYQQGILSIVNYIKNRSGIKDARFYGAKRFSNPIGKCQLKEEYDAKLAIFPDMWSWDFLYGYLFEYYLGAHSLNTKHGDKDVSLSIIQVSDDGFIKSETEKRSRLDIDSFNQPEHSNNWIIICVGYGHGWYYIPQIMTNDAYSPTTWSELAVQTTQYIINSSSDTYVNRVGVNGENCFFLAKRFPMEDFFDAKSIDNLLIEFGEQLNQEEGIEIFRF